MKASFFISIIFFSPFLLLNTPAFGQTDKQPVCPQVKYGLNAQGLVRCHSCAKSLDIGGCCIASQVLFS